MSDFYIGLTLAFVSCFFIGSSFILKKKALLKSAANSNRRAGQGGHSYLREWLWWTGVSIMASGEACNFAAFAFAPASVVTSLGALSVLVTAILSSYILKEKLSLLGKIGCALCILGATMIVIHAPRDGDVKSMVELGEKMQDNGFIVYMVLVVAFALFLIFYMAPRYGRSHIFVFIAICSIIGSLTVLGCKGLGLAVKEQLRTGSLAELLRNPFVWFWFFVVIFCIAIQLNYLNKALDIFNISMVTSIYYVSFTSCVIVASGILYKEWSRLGSADITGGICGFLTTVIGVFQMQAFNRVNINIAHFKRTIFKTLDSKTPLAAGNISAETAQTHRRRRSVMELTHSEPLLTNNDTGCDGGCRMDQTQLERTNGGDQEREDNRAVSV